MSVKNYRDLIVWQKAMELIPLVYEFGSPAAKREIRTGRTAETRSLFRSRSILPKVKEEEPRRNFGITYQLHTAK